MSKKPAREVRASASQSTHSRVRLNSGYVTDLSHTSSCEGVTHAEAATSSGMARTSIGPKSCAYAVPLALRPNTNSAEPVTSEVSVIDCVQLFGSSVPDIHAFTDSSSSSTRNRTSQGTPGSHIPTVTSGDSDVMTPATRLRMFTCTSPPLATGRNTSCDS